MGQLLKYLLLAVARVLGSPMSALAGLGKCLVTPVVRWHADHLAAALARRLDLSGHELALNSIIRDLMRLQIEIEALQQIVRRTVPVQTEEPGAPIPFPQSSSPLPRVG
jgi:hypothetical protein